MASSDFHSRFVFSWRISSWLLEILIPLESGIMDVDFLEYQIFNLKLWFGHSDFNSSCVFSRRIKLSLARNPDSTRIWIYLGYTFFPIVWPNLGHNFRLSKKIHDENWLFHHNWWFITPIPLNFKVIRIIIS